MTLNCKLMYQLVFCGFMKVSFKLYVFYCPCITSQIYLYDIGMKLTQVLKYSIKYYISIENTVHRLVISAR